MTATSETKSPKKQLLNKVQAELSKRVGSADIRQLADFAGVFWGQLQLDDWKDKEVCDIAGCCHSLWLLMKENNAEPNVEVFNPTLDEHGWLCRGTVIMAHQKDAPFLVDSLRLELSRQNLPMHLIKSTLLTVFRGEGGECLGVHSVRQPSLNDTEVNTSQEFIVYIEVGLISDEGGLGALRQWIQSVLEDVRVVVDDYRPMLNKVESLTGELLKAKKRTDTEECLALIEWLKGSHFTFLGYQEFVIDNDREQQALLEKTSSRLGLTRRIEGRKCSAGRDPESDCQCVEGHIQQGQATVVFSKSACRSTVHRPVYPDCIVFRRFDAKGVIVGEHRFLGLFTYAVYSTSPKDIPILRTKVADILQRSGMLPESHDSKNLIRVLESYPRDELFQADFDSLFETVMGVASISERRVVKLFMRDDSFGKFVNCVIYVPRDIYSTRIRKKIENIIGTAIGSQEFDSTTHFSESTLARAHIVFRLSSSERPQYDPLQLEHDIIDVTKGWSDRFETALVESYGDALGLKYYRQYASAFSVSYQDNFDARATINDINMQENLKTSNDIAMHFFHTLGSQGNTMRFKVMKLDEPLELSDVIPILEHLGFRVVGEHPYQIRRADGAVVWMHDFSLRLSLSIDLELQVVSQLFEDAFAAVWYKKTDSDAFNRLVLGACLTWQEVLVLRAYAGYMKQTSFNFTQDYIADTLTNQLDITRKLVSLFKAYFDPSCNDGGAVSLDNISKLKVDIETSLDALEHLDEDKILRRYFDFINGTLRTNFFQNETESTRSSALSLKFSPRDICNIPEPRPLYEIYVYSPRVEGVHLRGAKVARGGLRWSDRLQDYRTEVLGLVKAQQVKNSVIVPNGAKGGFVAKHLSRCKGRDEIQAEGIACYKMFIRGLLDVTDNYVKGELIPPKDVVCRDDADPYLVVAADKGTATFSDIANSISEEYGHWLGDAFASGGSVGYDHKKMGITAKGAWISVQRHFREEGRDIQNEPFSVLGIGDMSGDVFGNGMLLSQHIWLVAAFNHMHIFIDPTPDETLSFNERSRLFNLPRSGWDDYNAKIISAGGGVFSRSLKSIKISPQMKAVFSITANRLTPTELISALLKSRVDLMWNGGIGTYVKSSAESDGDVGDKANDVLRVNGRDLRCRVFGEGGNLGITQLGRIEYSLNGGGCNTDFIDNAAGVDCSDHEVNIKILLDEMIVSGDLTSKQRNHLLESMTESVSELVLMNNYRQTAALSLAQFQVSSRMGEYRRFIQFLEAEGLLDRALEFLPDEEHLSDRESKSLPLTRPELSVLISYAKVMLKDEFIKSNIASEPCLQKSVESAFPAILSERYPDQVYTHRLMKEIVATQTANDLINSLGITSMHRLMGAASASFKDIAVSFVTTKNIFRLDLFQVYLKTLDNTVSEELQMKMMANMIRRVRRGTRWFLVRARSGCKPEDQLEFFQRGISELNPIMGDVLLGNAGDNWSLRCERYTEMGVSSDWVMQLAMPDNLFSGLSVVEVSRTSGCDVRQVAEVFFHLYDKLNLEWFATQLSDVGIESYWQAMARETFLDDLEAQMRVLVSAITSGYEREKPSEKTMDVFMAEWLLSKEQWVSRWLSMVNEVQHSKVADFAMFSVAIRKLIELAQSCSLDA